MLGLIQNSKNNIKLIIIFYSLSTNLSLIAKDLKLDPKYGNGQNTKFVEAIYNLSPPITTAELQELENSIPPRLTDRFFIRVGFNNCSSMVSQVKNSSLQVATKDAKIANGSHTAKSKYGGELSFGYKWDRFSLELEALATENMKFNKNPLFSNQPGTLASTVKAQGIFLNSYYDFISLMAFRGFVGIGLGAGLNRTNANFANNPPISTGLSFPRRTIGGAYNLFVGCKFNLFSQLFINAAIRYTSFAFKFSGVNWRDEMQNLNLTGQHTIMGFSLSITHLFL